jgi:hypothetical protein
MNEDKAAMFIMKQSCIFGSDSNGLKGIAKLYILYT